MNEAYKRPLVPLLIAAFGAVCYGVMLWTVVPADISASRYWEAFLFTTRAGQVSGLALATIIYVSGLLLCIVACSTLLPIRSPLVRRSLSIPGALVGGFGALLVWTVLACFIDKVR
jgi:hypothetical protein